MADVILKITIPDAYVQRTLDAFNGLAERDISLKVDYQNMNLNFEPKTVDENNVEFGERVIRQSILHLIKLYELDKDFKRFTSEKDAIAEVSETVPEDLLT
jgi:hypothetical protein